MTTAFWPTVKAKLYTLSSSPDFRAGMRDMAVLLPGFGAWGLVTGVAMIKGGWPVWLALTMSLTVYSAGSQLAALALLSVHTPIFIVLATAFCANLRFVIFSLQLRPYLLHMPWWQRLLTGYLTADLGNLLFMQRVQRVSPMPLTKAPNPQDNLRYLNGANTINWLGWQTTSISGILLAQYVPTNWGLEFAGVLALLGLTYSTLIDRLSLVAVVMAATASIAAFALPYKLNLVVAIAMAVMAALLYDQLRSSQLSN